MTDHNNIREIQLSDGTIIYGYEGEYISSIIDRTHDYYEINDLQKFSQYIPNNPVIYDIGSNIGNHTLYFCNHLNAKKVFSFEPIPQNADMLEKNIGINRLNNNIEVFRMAVGEKPGYAILSINETNMGECKIVEQPNGSVPVDAIDNMGLPAPDFIKIDVEGSELQVLLGMTQLLLGSSPVLWIEINDRFEDVDRFLVEHQYELVDKHQFNHIYMKSEMTEMQLHHMRQFKGSIVPLYNQTLLDKWNLNNALKAEKEQVRTLRLESKQDKARYEAEFVRLKQELADERSGYEAEILQLTDSISRLNSALQELTAQYARLQTQYDEETRNLKRKMTQLQATLDEQAFIVARYMRLRNSLLGKIGAKLWKMFKK